MLRELVKQGAQVIVGRLAARVGLDAGRVGGMLDEINQLTEAHASALTLAAQAEARASDAERRLAAVRAALRKEHGRRAAADHRVAEAVKHATALLEELPKHVISHTGAGARMRMWLSANRIPAPAQPPEEMAVAGVAEDEGDDGRSPLAAEVASS